MRPASSSTASAPPACAIARQGREAVAQARREVDPLRRRLRLAAAAAVVRRRSGRRARRHGIPVVHELPGVGKNLQDHLDFILAWTSKDPDMIGLGLRGSLNLVRHIMRWRKDGTGMIATPYAEGWRLPEIRSGARPARPATAFLRRHRRRSRPQAASRLWLFLPCLRAQAVFARRGRAVRRRIRCRRRASTRATSATSATPTCCSRAPR